MTQFKYKPLEKSSKRELSPDSQLRKKLDRFDPVLVPLEAAYEVVKPLPVIGPVTEFLVKFFAYIGLIGIVVVFLITAVALAAIMAVWLSDVAGPTQY